MSELRKYQTVDEATGEVIDLIKYLEGRPKQYRFNGQNGQFNINGDKVLTDEKGKAVKSYTIIPVAWRVFEENLFGRGRKDRWVEVFFVDERKCLSTIMFNNTTLEEFMKLESELFYDDVTLSEVCLTITPEQITSEKSGQKTAWYIGRMSFQPAPREVVKMYREFAQDYRIYRADTLTSTAVYERKSDTFYLPHEPAPVAELPQQTQTAEA